MKIKTHAKLLMVGLTTSFAFTVGHAAEKPVPLVERGRYLVNHVAMCGDCHSPRNERGEFIPDAEMTGSVLGFAPTVPMPVWAPAAPNIAGLQAFTPEQAIKFLMTGERPTGAPIRPPMPEVRLEKTDAEAVVAYLKSLAKKS